MVQEKEIRTRGRSDHLLFSEAEKFYEDYWQEGSKISETTRIRNQAILDYFFPQRPKGKTILEIGVGGEGGLLYDLKEENRVQGLDVSASAKRNSERLGIAVALVNVDREGIPFPDEAVDIVFAFEVFEHFANPQYALEEIHRVLKPGGCFLVSIPNPLIHHWPRLFYPALFEERSFQEFLMINDFWVKRKLYLGQNHYHARFSTLSEKALMWCWECEKNMPDGEVYFEYGLYFWKQKNEKGIRTRPIEAADLFRKSLEKGGGGSFKARFFLTWSLMYRFLYDETEEFLNHVMVFFNKATAQDLQERLPALFALTFLNLEMKRLAIPLLDEEAAVNIFGHLRRSPGADPYLQVLSQWGTGSFDEECVAALFPSNP